MRLQRFTPGPRRGFTLVEVMVAAGLCVLILTVMTYAFRSGMDTFSHLKSTGELQERLRSAELILRSDLSADHFDAESGGKLSRVRLDQWDPTNKANTVQPPRQGYFRIVQGSVPTAEGAMDGIQSTRATDHAMAFTVKRSGLRDTEAFTASVPAAAVNTISPSGLPNLLPATAASTFASEWAEVVYFLSDPPNSVAQSTPGGLPMKTLYRRTRVVLNKREQTPTNWQTAVGGAANLPQYDGISYGPAPNYYLNDCFGITDPINRFGGRYAGVALNSLKPRTDSSSVATGDDVVLTNVLSFEIRPTWVPNTLVSSGTLGPNRRVVPSPQTTNTDYPFDDLPTLNNGTGGNTWNQDGQFAAGSAAGGKRVFDTWTSSLNGWNSTTPNANAVPFLARVTGVQIKIRIFDPKNNMARQVTLIQDL